MKKLILIATALLLVGCSRDKTIYEDEEGRFLISKKDASPFDVEYYDILINHSVLEDVSYTNTEDGYIITFTLRNTTIKAGE